MMKFKTLSDVLYFFRQSFILFRHCYYYYYYYYLFIGLAVRVFANGPGDLGSIPGRVIPKTQKMVLDASLLNTQHYKVRIKGKVEQSREGIAPSPTPSCSSYRKGSLRVTLDYGRPLYFIYLLSAILNKSWRQHPTKHQLSGHLPPITKTIQVRRIRHAGHYWRSRDELISDVLLWNPTYG